MEHTIMGHEPQHSEFLKLSNQKQKKKKQIYWKLAPPASFKKEYFKVSKKKETS
jgi:hypothetical protein